MSTLQSQSSGKEIPMGTIERESFMSIFDYLESYIKGLFILPRMAGL